MLNKSRQRWMKTKYKQVITAKCNSLKEDKLCEKKGKYKKEISITVDGFGQASIFCELCRSMYNPEFFSDCLLIEKEIVLVMNQDQ